MLAINVADFLAVSAMCPGQSSKHKHASWGLNSSNRFATADETAYPMGLARLQRLWHLDVGGLVIARALRLNAHILIVLLDLQDQSTSSDHDH